MGMRVRVGFVDEGKDRDGERQGGWMRIGFGSMCK